MDNKAIMEAVKHMTPPQREMFYLTNRVQVLEEDVKKLRHAPTPSNLEERVKACEDYDKLFQSALNRIRDDIGEPTQSLLEKMWAKFK